MKPEDLGNVLIEMGRALTAKPYPRDSAEFAVRNVFLVAILAGAQACNKLATEPETLFDIEILSNRNKSAK